MICKFKRILQKLQNLLLRHHWEKMDRLLLLQGKAHADRVRSLSKVENLEEAEFRVFSQWGEDGIIQYLISKAPGEWKEAFEDKGLIQPNGGSILGCANYWFSNNLHKQYDESVFLETINDIFLDNQDKLKSRLLTINRDNSAALMGEFLEKKSLVC